jgi:hypothetical protein
MSRLAPFQQAGSVSLSASTSSVGAVLPAQADTLVVTNTAAAPAWIILGSSNTPPTASVGSGFPVQPGAQRVIGVSPLILSVAAILTSGSGEIGTGSII